MRSFAVKGWLLGAARLSISFVKICQEFPSCEITLVLNGTMKVIDGTRVMQWMCILGKMESDPRSVLQIGLEGEGEELLFSQMISCLWELDIDDNMFMIVLPNKAMQRTLSDPTISSRGKSYSIDCLEAYNRF